MIWRLIVGGLWKPLAALVALLGAWVAGKRSGAVRAENRGLKDYQKTRKAMDDAANDIYGDDPDAARRFLRERGKQ